MTKYIENVNVYLSQMKIKQTYISLKTGIDGKKIVAYSDWCTGYKQHRYGKNSICVGEKNGFLMKDSFFIPQIM